MENQLRPAAPITLLGGVWYILTRWKRYWLRALPILFLMTLYLLFKTYFALQVKSIIDGLQGSGPRQNLGATIGLLGIGFVIAFGSRLWAERMIAQTGINIINDLRVRVNRARQNVHSSTL